MRRAVVLAFAVFATSSPVGAQSPPDAPTPPTLPVGSAPIIDERFAAIEAALRVDGPSSAYFGGRGLPAGTRTDGVAALLRFSGELPPAELADLLAAGVNWHQRGDVVVRVGSIYSAFVEFRALPLLSQSASLVYAEVGWHPVVLSPLESTGAQIGAIRARAMPSLEAGGAGAVIGDIDSGVDVLHPHFFRPDGGAFAWIDADNDGVPTPGVDYIDYDRDGVGSFNERMLVLDGAVFEQGKELVNDDGQLDVTRDWLYIDANEDGSRNSGLAAGFTEFDPGYGEPMFVPDDADRNGVLDVGERVLLLGSSKVRRFVTTARSYTRGENLIAAADVGFGEQIFHGTGVASILVGGESFRARSGVAPDADLIMYSSHIDAPGAGFEESAQFASIQDAAQSGVDVLVHEWTVPATAPIDGSGNLEEAMRVARDGGVVQVNPVGNLNRAEKHTELDVTPATVGRMGFQVGAGFASQDQVYPYSSIYGSIYWRVDQQPVFTLRSATGDEVVMPTDGSIVSIGSNNVQATSSTSTRGTRRVGFVIWNADPDVGVAQGDWMIEIAATAADRFVGRIADFWSGWSVGVRWLNPTSGAGTVVYPATADAAFGVGAYSGRFALPDDGSGVGELRGYSGRGPRIDGARVVRIAGPDDPYAAWGVSPAWLEAGAGRSWFTLFGGTSGAAPHVAGAVALMRSLSPAATAVEIEDRLVAAARRDAMTGTALPDRGWGAGKLDVYSAVYGAPARPMNSPPVAAIVVQDTVVDGERSSDPDGDELQFRWDLDYDGVWDTEWGAGPRTELPNSDDRVIRLEVRDGRGGAAGAVFVIHTPDQQMEDADADVAAAVDSSAPGSEPPSERPCGCSSAAESASWSTLFVGLMLARRRRRR